MRYGGYDVVLSPHVCDPKVEQVRRSWRERLLSWPWRPWVSTRFETRMVPSDRTFIVGNTMIMHPAFLEQLRSHPSRGAGEAGR